MPLDNNRQLPTMCVRAEIDASTINNEDRTVEIVFTTGEAGLRGGYWQDPFIEELDITTDSIREARLKKGLSLIDSHKAYQGIRGVFGITEGYEIKNGELRGKVRFSKRPEADEVFKDVQDKILRHFSLGYRVWEYTEKKSGKDDNALPVMRATDWEPTELSIVPVSFETTNGLRSADNSTYPVKIIEDRTMPQENNAPAAAATAPAQQAPAEPTRENQPAAPAAAPEAAPAAEPEAAPTRQAEQQTAGPLNINIEEYRAIADAAGMDAGEASVAFLNQRSLETFRQEALTFMQRQQPQIFTQQAVPESNQRQDASQTYREGVENALMYRANPGIIQLNDHGRSYLGLTLMETARQYLQDNGQLHRGMSPMQVAERALHSTSDFSQILAAIANKSMRSSYTELEQTWQSLGRRSTLTDFKDKNILALGDAPDLKKLNEMGEFKRGTMSETGEKYRLHSYGRIFGITRQTLINDDMDAFTRLPSMWGASASRLQSDIVWGGILGYDFDEMKAKPTLMADGKNLFHADHNNLLTGAGAALSKTALSSLRKMARQQKTIDKKRMNVMLQTIVVPTELETAAEELLINTIMPNQDSQTNSFKGKYNIVCEPRLDDVSEEQWYAFANPALVDTFEYAFLAGEEELNIETRVGFDVDGVEIRARTDFGMGVVDSRGMYKSNGK